MNSSKNAKRYYWKRHYFRLSKKEQMYGYMASIILFVVWIYYSAVVLYFGAELTRVLAQRAPAKTAANTQEHT